MEKVPLLRHEIMVYFYKFKMANKELVEEAARHFSFIGGEFGT